MTELISVGAISPLRQRLIDDMTMRGFSRETQRNYIRDVGRFATHLGRSPHTATAEEVRQFQIEQHEAGLPIPTMNSIVSALRFFFTYTLDRPDLARKLVRTRHPRNLPVVLSRDEVARLLNATTCLKHQVALSVAYGTGLRVAEVAALKVSDIDSARMLLRVERGKGGRYRNAMLPADLLTLLREWWKLGRRLFLTRLLALFDTDRLVFRGQLASLADRRAFLRHLAPVRSRRWVVYAKPPFAGPKAVLAYLSRYTHRVAISNRRLLAFNEKGVTFRYKDYRRDTAHQQQVMTLGTDEFIRRFMLHVLPRGFHRIRHYGLLASSSRKASLAWARELLNVISTPVAEAPEPEQVTPPPCPCCGGQMVVIQIFARWCQPRGPPRAPDSSGGSS